MSKSLGSFFIFVALQLATLLFVFAALAQTPPAGSVQITGVSLAGSGCPSGSVQVVLSPDASAFTVLYDRFSLQVNPGNPRGQMECEVSISLNKPAKLGFGVESADFRGFVSLDQGMVAEQRVLVSSGATPGLRQINSDFGVQRWQGPVQQEYVTQTRQLGKNRDILNCVPMKSDTKIIVRSRVNILALNKNGAGLLSVDSADGKMAQKYSLRWQDCAKGLQNAIGQIGELIKRTK